MVIMNKNLSIYYHIWSPPNTDLWKLMVDEQLKRVYRSGILDQARFYCAINGKQGQRIAEFVSLYDWVRILEVSNDDDQYEGFTLKHLSEECLYDIDLKVLYFHTKGMSHFAGARDHYSDRKFRAINSWRHQMEWGVIDRWKDAVDKLDSYDVSGVNYCIDPWPHMSGNFWWSNASYVKTLHHPINDSFPQDSKDFGPIQRMNFEKWIGLNDPKCFSFYDAPFSYDHKGMVPDVQPTPPGEPNWFWLYRDDIEPYYRKGN